MRISSVDVQLFLCSFSVSTFESEDAAKPVPAAAAYSGDVSSATEPGSCDAHSTKEPAIGNLQPEAQPEATTDSQNQQVFVRSFKFHPDLPIRIDYEAKGFKTEIVSF